MWIIWHPNDYMEVVSLTNLEMYPANAMIS